MPKLLFSLVYDPVDDVDIISEGLIGFGSSGEVCNVNLYSIESDSIEEIKEKVEAYVKEFMAFHQRSSDSITHFSSHNLETLDKFSQRD